MTIVTTETIGNNITKEDGGITNPCPKTPDQVRSWSRQGHRRLARQSQRDWITGELFLPRLNTQDVSKRLSPMHLRHLRSSAFMLLLVAKSCWFSTIFRKHVFLNLDKHMLFSSVLIGICCMRQLRQTRCFTSLRGWCYPSDKRAVCHAVLCMLRGFMRPQHRFCTAHALNMTAGPALHGGD